MSESHQFNVSDSGNVDHGHLTQSALVKLTQMIRIYWKIKQQVIRLSVIILCRSHYLLMQTAT